MASIVATRRVLRPRDPVAVMPPSFSTENCEVVVGVKPRRLRELVTTWEIPHTRVGQLTVVATADWLDALARHSASGQVLAADDPAESDDLSASLGYVPKAGAR